MLKADCQRKPVLLVFAGPNGSGKTTLTHGLPVFGTYINADDLKNEYNLTDMEAAQQAEALRNELLNRGVDFSFETVLSTERNLLLMERAKDCGYEVQCIYVLTCDENINVARVKMRHASGGHDVPEEKIRKRYHRALAFLPRVITACDKILIYDNSVSPTLIFSKEYRYSKAFPSAYWPEESLRTLLGI
jgi:predicted ABC-type ATPase